ncbi:MULTISPECIES: hypothetical protein [unclassified Cryobacterium]|uniref:hypothetical protein n=1 Tax=unclassified Cryobacterium TaxID=2649013 RepID=UPI002AB497B7|nr:MULTISPECIES: hypothetical protein [unclassified Cryobacterium]MDY7528464.1 hypothetical protein [Cryobacterium sp. 10C2]MDY7555791.1 hypothetical protein [Cryobacterium sp. 10C3]MEB0289184.1 hypothetical protein [Cryobacterium sp. 10C2]
MAQVGAARGAKERLRTINFYEIVKYKNPRVNERMKHADWNAILKSIKDVPLSKRVWEGPTKILIGEVLTVEGQHHLKLSLVRNQDAWLDVYNPEAQSIAELNLGDAGELLETSIVAFLGFGNVIGMIQGSTSAPTPNALQEWLNGLKILGPNFTVETQVMVSHEAQELVKQSTEASQIEVKMHTNRADALEKRGSKLSQIFKAVNAEYGPMTVTVILRASKARDQSEGRVAIRNEAKKLVEAAGAKEVTSAKAKLIFVDADESTRTQEVDFAKQKITAKRKIATTGEDGNPVRNASAIQAILTVAESNHDELRAIVNSK